MKQFRVLAQAKYFLRTCIVLSALVCSLLGGIFVVHNTAHGATVAPTQCKQYRVPVHLSVLALTTYHVASWLCYSQTPGGSVQLLVHGATYSHVYWDFSCPACQTNNYSYVQYMAQEGYTTFNYDRLGSGASDHPLPELVTIQADAYVLSQLISDLKTGAYGGPAFQKVIVVAHSVGSAISVDEASDPTLMSPDGLILSGFIHFVDPTELVTLATDIHPALLDPDPRLNDLPGYVTTIPNSRGKLFYDLANADPNVIAEDEATKEAITDSEFATFFTVEATTVSRQIHVPVLEALGQFDNLFCLGTFNCINGSNVQSYEAPFFSPAAQLQVVIIPQAGHDLNLQKNAAAVWYPLARQWIQAHT
jgi:alpha-beta hydrolase superfamily lysophospholipase